MVTTSHPGHWKPVRPRITIYGMWDSTYSTPLYSYDAWTEAGTTARPVGLEFETALSNPGSFSLEIEDSTGTITEQAFLRGNRVVIELSKTGENYAKAFKGLVRSCKQKLYGTTGRSFFIEGYSYMIRLNERMLNTIKEASMTGPYYNRDDWHAWTNYLIYDLLTTSGNYYYSDPGDLGEFLKSDYLYEENSFVEDWIPRLDASMTSVASAINSVLEYGDGVLTLNFDDDQLNLASPTARPGLVKAFLITDQPNYNADNADITMYPIGQYKAGLSYDYPGFGNRFLASVGQTAICYEPTVTPDPMYDTPTYPSPGDFYIASPQSFSAYACEWQCPADGSRTDLRGLRVQMATVGDWSGITQNDTLVIVTLLQHNGHTALPSGALDQYVHPLYMVPQFQDPDADPDVQFPSNAPFVVGALPGDPAGPLNLVPGQWYWIMISWIGYMSSAVWFRMTNSTDGATSIYRRYYWPISGDWLWDNTLYGTVQGGPPRFKIAFTEGGGPCGGPPVLQGTENLFMIGTDLNAANRLGAGGHVERVLTDMPPYVQVRQTIEEYTFDKMAVYTKPAFTYDFPSVTMPGYIPKAGDFAAVVSKFTGAGTKTAPVQTGVISQASYKFSQDEQEALGLNRLAITTTGIRRGYY